MNAYFLTAALFSAVTTFIHGWFGGREIAAPLLSVRDMHPVARHMSFSSWHMVSIVLGVMSGCFLIAALRPQSLELAMLATALAAAFTLWNAGLVLWRRQRFGALPQWALFLAIAAAGGIGLIKDLV